MPIKENPIYIDALDTVKTSNSSPEINKTIAKFSLMTHIILLNNPVFSQTQCFDSTIFIEALKSEGFRNLVNEGYIKTTWYNAQGSNVIKILDALKNALNPTNFFHFSGFDFFNEGSVKDRKDLRKACIEYIDKNHTPDIGEKNKTYFCEFVDNIRKLNFNKKNQYRAVGTSNNLLDHLKKIHLPSKDEKAYVNKIIDNNSNKRSDIYDLIDNFDVESIDISNKLKNIIDICYNLVISESLGTSFNEITLTEKTMFGDNFSTYITDVNPANNIQYASINVSEINNLELLTWNDIFEYRNYFSELSITEKDFTKEVEKYCENNLKNKIKFLYYKNMNLPCIIALVDKISEIEERVPELIGYLLGSYVFKDCSYSTMSEIILSNLKFFAYCFEYDIVKNYDFKQDFIARGVIKNTVDTFTA